MEDRRYFLKKSAIIAAMTAFPALQSCIPLNTIKAKVPSKSKKIKTAVIIWYSQTGNTQKCGKVLAKTFEKNGIKVIYGDLREIDTSIVPGADLIVVGSPVFYYETPDFVKYYISFAQRIKF